MLTGYVIDVRARMRCLAKHDWLPLSSRSYICTGELALKIYFKGPDPQPPAGAFVGLLGQFQGLVALLLLGTTIGYNCNLYSDRSSCDADEQEQGCVEVSCVEGDTTTKEVLVLISATSSGFMLQLSCMAFLKKGGSLLQRARINVICLYPWIVVHLAVAVLAALAAADAWDAGTSRFKTDEWSGWMTFFTTVVVGVSLASLARVVAAISKSADGPSAAGDEPAVSPEVLAIAKTMVEASACKAAEKAARISELEGNKQEAIEAEDYDEAKRIKLELTSLRRVTTTPLSIEDRLREEITELIIENTELKAASFRAGAAAASALFGGVATEARP